MRAVIQSAYGPAHEVLELGEVERPRIADDEVLVRVRATSVHADVWHVVTGYPYALRLMGSGFRRPKQPIPGSDLAGVVEAIGKNVTDFQVGDAVFGESHRRFQWVNGGTFAEYVAVPQDVLVTKPKNVSFEAAAAVATPGIIALFNLQNGELVRSGQHVLVNGAAGSVGSIALQVAKARGARVTGVDSADKLALVRSLGADDVIDYQQEDCTQGKARYDLIFDVASTLSLARCKRVLAPEGLYVFIGHDHYGARTGRVLGSIPRALSLTLQAFFRRNLPKPDFAAPIKGQCLSTLRDLLAAGQLTPHIGQTFPLSGIQEAMAALQDRNTCGRVVLTP
jgi:NADPH:quinone reductase-like Zn-dependent oxidoreductase